MQKQNTRVEMAAKLSQAGQATTQFEPPRHIIWSTNTLNLSDSFQRQHYIRQALLQGRKEDIRQLDLHEVARLLDDLRLPAAIHSLWKRFFQEQGYAPR